MILLLRIEANKILSFLVGPDRVSSVIETCQFVHVFETIANFFRFWRKYQWAKLLWAKSVDSLVSSIQRVDSLKSTADDESIRWKLEEP